MASMHALTRLATIVTTAVLVAGCGSFGGRATGFECVGLSQGRCQAMYRETLTSVPTGATVTSVTIRCTVAACTEQEGAAEVTTVLGDGQRTVVGQEWATAPEAAPATDSPLPVEPICQGVPLERCLEQAGAIGAQDKVVTAIVVRCSAQCTTQAGDGATVVTFADGTTTSGSWSYRVTGP